MTTFSWVLLVFIVISVAFNIWLRIRINKARKERE